MNKQELINKLQKLLTTPSEIEGYDFDYGYDCGIERAIYLAEDLDEQQAPINKPEKPVVPQFVADWYEEHKDDIEYNLYNLCTDFRKKKLRVDLHVWFGDDNNKPIETLVKMKLFGYEVEKEKLYTVKFVTEDFGKIYIGLFKNYKKLGIISLVSNDDELRTHFNEEELKRFKFWDNPAFEIKKVKE